MRVFGLVVSLSLLAVPALAADEAAMAARQGLTGLRAIGTDYPTAQLTDFAPDFMDVAIISRAGFGGHGSIFVQAGTRSNICSAPRVSSAGAPRDAGKWACEAWGVVALKTDAGTSDVITTDNQNAALFVHAMLDGKRQTLLLAAKRAPGSLYQPAAVTFTAYALHVDWGIDTEDLSFQPVKSWDGAGRYCDIDAAVRALTGENRKERC